MVNAIRLIIKNGSVILFLVLQLISLFWVIKYNQKQGEIFFFSLQLAAQSLNSKVKNTTDYFALRDKMEKLKEENANLLKYHFNSVNTNVKLNEADSNNIQFINQYNVVNANVINNSVSRKNNYITLDKGGRDGINPGMAAISLQGIVGIVIDTTANFSSVMSILHSNSKISAKLKRSGYFGSLVWRDFDSRILTLEDIQKYADVLVGDTVVTSGFSIVFPEGLPIGKVSLVGVDPGAFTYTIKVNLFESISSIGSVYLVDNKKKTEKQLLEERRKEDE